MIKEFVSFDTARILKELGFLEECYGYYEYSLTSVFDEQDGFDGPFGWEQGELNFNKGYFINNSQSDLSNENWLNIGVPLYQQVEKWLIEKYNIYLNRIPEISYYEMLDKSIMEELIKIKLNLISVA